MQSATNRPDYTYLRLNIFCRGATPLSHPIFRNNLRNLFIHDRRHAYIQGMFT